MGGLAGGVPLRLLLADEQGIVRQGVRLILEREPGFAVVGEAADGAAALRLFARLCDDPGVDVVLADLVAPAAGGAELARRVKAHRPGARVLFLTLHHDPAHAAGLLEAGADGYLLKQAAVAELPAAVRAVAAGETYLSPAVAKGLVAHLRRDRTRERHEARLSAREREVLARLAEGRTSKEIARALGLATKTVENHRGHILEKLGVTNTVEAVTLALREGLLADPSGGVPTGLLAAPGANGRDLWL
jgi:two-component system response regulator NreC